MAIQITIPYEKVFSSGRSLEETFQYLANFEQSIPDNFSGVKTFEKAGEGLYRWQFEKIGHSGYELAIKLLTECKAQAPKRIEIQSVAEPGSSEFTGKWELASGFDGCQVHFKATFGLELNIPFLMKAVAVPLAQKEFTNFFDRYIQRVEKNLEQ
jgi:hypothetical protein